MNEDAYLQDLRIISQSTKSTLSFARLQPSLDEITLPYSDYLRSIWSIAKDLEIARGWFFELAVASILSHSELRGYSRGVIFRGMAGTSFDLALWDVTSDSPITLQLTSTVRERYKLADLEAFKLKSKYPRSKCYLLTFDYTEAARLQSHVFESLNQVIFVGSDEFDHLVENLVDRADSIPQWALEQ